MCMYDDSDGFEFSHEKLVRARKQHACSECSRKIEPGEIYETFAGRYEGWFTTTKTCAHCCAARRWLIVVCSGWVFEAVEMDLAEHVTGEESELRSAPLTRLLRWMRADWRDRNGNLRPVEAVEAVVVRAIDAYNVQFNHALGINA